MVGASSLGGVMAKVIGQPTLPRGSKVSKSPFKPTSAEPPIRRMVPFGTTRTTSGRLGAAYMCWDRELGAISSICGASGCVPPARRVLSRRRLQIAQRVVAMGTMLKMATLAGAISLAASHVAVAQDREAQAMKLFNVSERLQQSGPCSELPFLWLTNPKMIAFLDSLLSGAYDDIGPQLVEFIACFEHQRVATNIRVVIHAEFPETKAAFEVAERGYFTEADIDEFIWLLKGTVNPEVVVEAEDALEISDGTEQKTLDEARVVSFPLNKPRPPSTPSEEAVAALLESLENEIQASTALAGGGGDTAPADERPADERKEPAQSSLTASVQQQTQVESAMTERARRFRDVRGGGGIVRRRMSFAPTGPENRRPRTQGAITSGEIEAIRRHFQNCWVLPEGLRDGPDIVVRVRFELFPDGSLRTEPVIVEQPRMRSREFRAMADSAQRAVQECTPLIRFPAASYEQWREIELTFDLKDLPGRRVADGE